jgi:hypothetical protein
MREHARTSANETSPSDQTGDTEAACRNSTTFVTSRHTGIRLILKSKREISMKCCIISIVRKYRHLYRSDRESTTLCFEEQQLLLIVLSKNWGLDVAYPRRWAPKHCALLRAYRFVRDLSQHLHRQQNIRAGHAQSGSARCCDARRRRSTAGTTSPGSGARSRGGCATTNIASSHRRPIGFAGNRGERAEIKAGGQTQAQCRGRTTRRAAGRCGDQNPSRIECQDDEYGSSARQSAAEDRRLDLHHYPPSDRRHAAR